MIWGVVWGILSAGSYIFFLELAVRYSNQLFWFGLLAILIPVIISSWFFHRFRKIKLASHPLRLPFYFLLLGGFLLMVFADRPALRQLLIIFTGLLVFLDLYFLYIFTRRSKDYPTKSLEQINSALIFCSWFFIWTVIFGWVAFLANIFWPALLAGALVSWVLIFEFLKLRLTESRPASFLAVVLSVLAVEFFWALSLWPIGFIIKGWLLTIIAGFMMYGTAAWQNKDFLWKNFIVYLALFLIIIAVVLGAARWV
jgi:hypothetical protein